MVDVTVSGLGTSRVRALTRQYCINDYYSNSFAAWKRLGSPQSVPEAQYMELERDGALSLCGAPEWRPATGGAVTIRVDLPRQGVSLIEISW